MDKTPMGLSQDEVISLQEKYGKNTVQSVSVTGWHIFLRQVRSPFVYLLLIAAVLSFFLGERTDAVMIIVFTTVNVALGFYQEYRSEATARLLTAYLRRMCTVVRDGIRSEVLVEDVVPGDIILLEAGDIIPADAKLIVSPHGIDIDESVVTGESIPVNKVKEGAPLLAGTTVTSGTATAQITAIGNQSELGKITKVTATITRVSAFEKNIDKVSKFTLKLIGVILLATYITNLGLKGVGSFLETTLFAIALAVSVIPEALPVVVTFSLSRGALRLARKGSIVKRLSAIEDLGGIEILATDKTGTITTNKLSVIDEYSKVPKLLRLAASCSAVGHDTIDSILSGLSTEPRALVDHIAFDASRRRSTALVETNGKKLVIMKGVPEEIHKQLGYVVDKKEQAWVTKQDKAGNRIIAIAARYFPISDSIDLAKSENKLELVGYLALADTVKPTAASAVAKAKKLNIAIKIISGDSVGVCFNIAKRVGLADSMDDVISGNDLLLLDDTGLHRAVQDHTVFARITPIQKSQIIDIMQEKYTVGFVGDGVNDAPALKSADVAIAVDHASDVAREAADIILTNKSLKTIVGGIEEGRIVFGNTAKYIKMTLAANVGNFFSVAIASLFITYLPMLPIQILLVNLLSDFPMIAVAADNIDSIELAAPQTYDIHEIAAVATIFGLVSSTFDLIFFAIFVRFAPAVLQTGWFIESIITELLFFYSIRSHLPFWRAVKPPRGITILTAVVIVITIGITYTPFGHQNIQFVSLPVNLLALTIGLIMVYLAVTEKVKLMYYRKLS